MEPGPLNKYCHQCHKSTVHTNIIGTDLLTCLICGSVQQKPKIFATIKLLSDRRVL